MMFSIRDHLDVLTPDGGSHGPHEGTYHCPKCGANNFKVNLKTGAYHGYGCDCTDTAEGKKQVREAISPPTWEKPPRPPRQQTFTYERLVNGDWEAIAQVVRHDKGTGKRSFYQKHWNGDTWANGLPVYIKKQTRLYRISSEVNRQAQGQPIFLVEGEGKVDALLQLGIPATCAIGGAGKWKQYGYPNYLEDLKDHQVVLCPDRDEPGVKHCEEVETDLLEHGIEVAGWLYAHPTSYLWKRLPKSGGYDVADWLANGADKSTILAAVEPRREFISHQQSSSLSAKVSGDDPENIPKLARKYRSVEKVWGSALRLNELRNQIELNGNPIEDTGELQLILALDYGVSVALNDCESIIKRLAKNNSYHPVAEYLEHCVKTYGSDTAILDHLASTLFGTHASIYNLFLTKTLVAAVARIFEPGCKVDTALFLSGPQGIGKSSFFRLLAGADWFDDSMGAATSERDERLKLHQFWFLEWSELEAIFKRKDIAATKSFISCSVDTVRPPYGRHAVSLKRRSIIVGTTNQDEFLTDSTGNRRFWVIPIRQRIDLEWLAQHRDRIWAAAVALYRSGYQWWLSADEEAIAAEFTDNYRTEDPWLAPIARWLRENSTGLVTTAQLLTHALDIEVGRQTKRDELRATDVLKSLGWHPDRAMLDGKRRRVWVEPPEPNPTTAQDQRDWSLPAASVENAQTDASQSVQRDFPSAQTDQCGQSPTAAVQVSRPAVKPSSVNDSGDSGTAWTTAKRKKLETNAERDCPDSAASESPPPDPLSDRELEDWLQGGERS